MSAEETLPVTPESPTSVLSPRVSVGRRDVVRQEGLASPKRRTSLIFDWLAEDADRPAVRGELLGEAASLQDAFFRMLTGPVRTPCCLREMVQAASDAFAFWAAKGDLQGAAVEKAAGMLRGLVEEVPEVRLRDKMEDLLPATELWACTDTTKLRKDGAYLRQVVVELRRDLDETLRSVELLQGRLAAKDKAIDTIRSSLLREVVTMKQELLRRDRDCLSPSDIDGILSAQFGYLQSLDSLKETPSSDGGSERLEALQERLKAQAVAYEKLSDEKRALEAKNASLQSTLNEERRKRVDEKAESDHVLASLASNNMLAETSLHGALEAQYREKIAQLENAHVIKLLEVEEQNASLQQQLRKAEEQVAECQGLLGKKKSELKRLSSKVFQLSSNVDVMASDLESREGQLVSLKKQLERQELATASAQDELSRRKGALRSPFSSPPSRPRSPAWSSVKSPNLVFMEELAEERSRKLAGIEERASRVIRRLVAESNMWQARAVELSECLESLSRDFNNATFPQNASALRSRLQSLVSQFDAAAPAPEKGGFASAATVLHEIFDYEGDPEPLPEAKAPPRVVVKLDGGGDSKRMPRWEDRLNALAAMLGWSTARLVLQRAFLRLTFHRQLRKQRKAHHPRRKAVARRAGPAKPPSRPTLEPSQSSDHSEETPSESCYATPLEQLSCALRSVGCQTPLLEKREDEGNPFRTRVDLAVVYIPKGDVVAAMQPYEVVKRAKYSTISSSSPPPSPPGKPSRPQSAPLSKERAVRINTPGLQHTSEGRPRQTDPPRSPPLAMKPAVRPRAGRPILSCRRPAGLTTLSPAPLHRYYGV